MDYSFDTNAAKNLPDTIRTGTSSWIYPGWKGIIYKEKYSSEKDFKENCLREYASHPLFRTVEIDRTFYNPPTAELLKQYASLVPDTFKWVSKVWERITIPEYPEHARYGKHAGKKNEHFLDSELFKNEVLSVYREPECMKHTGPFIFQFPYIASAQKKAVNFLPRLQDFLSALPKDFQYAIEIRNPEFLSDEYFHILNAHSATHCFNHWNFMPPLHTQMQKAAAAGGLSAPFYVTRILTPRGMTYAQAVKRFSPYTSVQEPIEEMRQDVLRLMKRADKKSYTAYVLINNRAEGNSPMTLDQIVRQYIRSNETTY